jgi:hypothetical protein
MKVRLIYFIHSLKIYNYLKLEFDYERIKIET